MITLAHRRNVYNAIEAADAKRFRRPNSGDVFILAAFLWSAFCFLLMVGGQRFAYQIARQGRSETVYQILFVEPTALAGIMLAGMLGLAVGFFVLTKYRWLATGCFLFSMIFAAAVWGPVHDFAFAFKYLTLIYLACFSALFGYKNFWRLVDTPGYRVVFFYLLWVAFAAIYNGFQIADLWFFATEVCLVIGFGIAWLSDIDSTAKLKRFNMMFAYAAVVVTLMHLLSAIVIPQFTVQGRFVSMFERATGFSVVYAPFVVALFWASMFDSSFYRKRVFSVFALIGFGLIVWSGTRNASVATILGVMGLWWVFRTKIIAYIGAAGIIGLLAQLGAGGDESIRLLVDRLGSGTNNRAEVWQLYLDLASEKLLFGYGVDGLAPALYGERLVATVSSYVTLIVPSPHNHYLGTLVRFGVVGLLLNALIFLVALLQAWRVIFSRAVSMYDKRVYVLPAILLLVVALQGIFEDVIGASGRGTLHGVIFATAIPLVYMHGKRLLDQSDGVDR